MTEISNGGYLLSQKHQNKIMDKVYPIKTEEYFLLTEKNLPVDYKEDLFVDRRFFFSASYGSADMEKFNELYPYGTDYDNFRVSGGFEFYKFKKQDLFWGITLQPSLTAGATMTFTRGGEANFGSHRDLFLGQVGLRNRLEFGLPVDILFEAFAGAGVSDNNNNFGKGLPLMDYRAINVDVEGRVGAEIVVTDSLSVMLYLAAGGDVGIGEINYWNAFWNLGVEVLFGRSESEKTVVYRHEDYYYKKEMVWQKEMMAIATNKPLPKLPEPKPQPSGPTVTYVVNNHSYVLPAFTFRILFNNDNPDIELSPQWFAGNFNDLPEADCFVNPYLNQYMLSVLDLQKFLQYNDPDNKYQIEIHVKGYANDTDTPEQQLLLAKLRANAVVQYLNASLDNGGVRYKSGLVEMAPERFRPLGKIFGATGNNGRKVLERKICGAFNAYGLAMGDLKASGNIKVIDDSAKLSADDKSYNNKSEIIKDFGLDEKQKEHLDPTQPIYRTVVLRLVVRKGDEIIQESQMFDLIKGFNADKQN